VISSKAAQFKKSLRDARMVPKVALVDPDLQAGVPRDVQVWSGLDALTQNVEAYLSCRATPMTDLFAERGMHAAAAGLKHLAAGDAVSAREPMALAALLSGLALANGGLGAAHGIAQALGVFGVPHGLACAVALPWVTAFNTRDQQVWGRYLRLAHAVNSSFDNDGEFTPVAQEVVGWLWRTTHTLEVPRLAGLPARYPHLPPLDDEGLAELARLSQGNSLSGNPVAMTDDDVVVLLRAMRDADGPETLLP
jgi:alcohol dehydrogenase class IV